MIESLKARLIIVTTVIVLAVIWLVPNFVLLDKDFFWPSKDRIVYGLDIQGGLHLVLEADVNELLHKRLNRISLNLQNQMKVDKISEAVITVSDAAPFFMDITVKSPENLNSVQKIIKDLGYSSDLQTLKETNTTLRLAYFDNRVKDMRVQIIDQAIEVIRNRIDEFGVSEPLLSAQGENRILIQLPGIEDSARAKELIKTTAQLEFGVVNEEFPSEKLFPLIAEAEKKGGYSLGKNKLTYREYIKKINKDLKEHLKENEKIVFEQAPSATNLQTGRIPHIVNIGSGLTGTHLEDAFVSQGEFNRPEVSFKFQPEGRKIFADLTGRIVGKQLSIILDQVLKAKPVVQGKIHSNPRITLGAGGTYEEVRSDAEMIATTLRAGSLPVFLRQLEEKTVGPTLGRDSIQKGKTAGLTGLILVMLFMLVYYRTLGIFANIALFLNMSLLLALLSSLSATLTLPGVAGIILTIGMAVDANVIIFERIKEELRRGASLKLAIKDGFYNAFSAILDANITTAIVCSVLMYFGTGLIRGFAVTLFCGIVTSLFTAVFVSRTLMDLSLLKFGLKKL
ncbi:MAG: protein translocase subunit SecD [Bdellovibrionales bacterium]|nr:protein translocase subunit SecD [Bdellovibrionales bacterium]